MRYRSHVNITIIVSMLSFTLGAVLHEFELYVHAKAIRDLGYFVGVIAATFFGVFCYQLYGFKASKQYLLFGSIGFLYAFGLSLFSLNTLNDLMNSTTETSPPIQTTIHQAYNDISLPIENRNLATKLYAQGEFREGRDSVQVLGLDGHLTDYVPTQEDIEARQMALSTLEQISSGINSIRTTTYLLILSLVASILVGLVSGTYVMSKASES